MSADRDYWTELKQLLRWYITPGLPLPRVKIVRARPGSSGLVRARLAHPGSYQFVRARPGSSGSYQSVEAYPGSSGPKDYQSAYCNITWSSCLVYQKTCQKVLLLLLLLLPPPPPYYSLLGSRLAS